MHMQLCLVAYPSRRLLTPWQKTVRLHLSIHSAYSLCSLPSRWDPETRRALSGARANTTVQRKYPSYRPEKGA